MIIITTALYEEAKPIILAYNLKKKCEKTPFEIFTSNNIVLVITGVGKLAAATATGYILTIYPKPQGIINIGIAGHKESPIGTIFTVDKIIDEASSKSYYPSFVYTPSCEGLSLMTKDFICKNYPQNTLVDMEASGFFVAASKFISIDYIAILKVVSDNQSNNVEHEKKQKISYLIKPHLSHIDHLMKEMEELDSLEKTEEISTSEAEKKFHFTMSEKYQLKDILEEIDLSKENKNAEQNLSKSKESKELIAALKEKKKAMKFSI
ncbi:MAG TPA: hypothetical protein P5048_01730 [Chlamydiales bacterium]|nr:hypothetical protein [Chlamydiales bacterium]